MKKIICHTCPRLAAYLEKIRENHPDGFNAPVPPFGDPDPRLLIVGLAPGRGTNHTGRPFTGDGAGELLYPTLVRYGWATGSFRKDGHDTIRLIDCCITNAVKCLPPENKPTGPEITACRHWLKQDVSARKHLRVILCLGTIAHNTTVRALGLKPTDYPFAHHAVYHLPDGLWLVSSYHCSKYNTSTKRLTPVLFQAVFETIKEKT